MIIADKNTNSSIKESIITETHNSNIELKYVDLASFKSVRAFAKDLNTSAKCIDILISNAGIGMSSIELTEDELEPVLQINYYSGFLLTHLLIGKSKTISFL